MAKKKNHSHKNGEHMTEFGEIVPTMFHWQSEDERRKTTKKLETLTDKNSNSQKNQIPPS